MHLALFYKYKYQLFNISFKYKHFYFNLLIGNNGVKYLIKTDLPNLELLYISTDKFTPGSCGIGSEGIKHLTKGIWTSSLHQLWFGLLSSAGNFVIIEMKIKCSWVAGNGLIKINSNSSNYYIWYKHSRYVGWVLFLLKNRLSKFIKMGL